MSDYYFDEEEILELLKEDDWPVFDDLFNNFATQDSSPPADEILPANEDSSPLADDEILPAHEVLDAPAPLPDPTKPSEETLSSSHPHHLLQHNMDPSHVILSGDSSHSVHHKKYEHWTIEEHKSFLFGLEIKKEKGWKQISDKYVPSKTASQVASHAQKYIKRKNTPMKERKRRSIHDTILEDIDIIRIDQHNWVPPTSNFIVQPHTLGSNWVPSTSNLMVQSHTPVTDQHNWIPPCPSNFAVPQCIPHVDQDNWVSPPSNLAAQSCTAHIDQYTWDPPPPNFAVQPPTPHIDQHNWVPSPPNFAPHTSLIDQDNWVPTPPDFAVQPHEMQRAQHMQMQQLNLHSSSPQMDEYRNFNSGHPQNELDLIAQQILEYKNKFNHKNNEGSTR
ncbi:hypothetical protein JHK87_048082 [Glycine soja]|nr:hypothetical protein JHK87_048082 [Glycine soja]